MRNSIAYLPIGSVRLAPYREEDTVEAVDINNLPKGVVTGSNLIQPPEEASPTINLRR